jgi:hypothetical protein
MQAIYQIIRSHFFIRLIVVFIIAAFSTTGWANNYTTQQQDTITETIIDSFITTQAVPEKALPSVVFTGATSTNMFGFNQKKSNPIPKTL